MIDNQKIEQIKNNLIKEIQKLIKIIKEEYKDLVNLPIDLDVSNRVHIENIGTVSLFVRSGHFYFPTDAFKVIEELQKNPNYGSIPNHKTYDENNLIINDNTYMTYLEHALLAGLTVEQYFEEILLHETMHFCGSGGGTGLREGINELKTRQLAKKYGLLTSACGYPKETKIAYELEKLFGEEIINKLAFSKTLSEIKIILDKVSPTATEFYFVLEKIMEQEFYTKYMKYNFPGAQGPLNKMKKYDEIDYTEAYELIEEYNKRTLHK